MKEEIKIIKIIKTLKNLERTNEKVNEILNVVKETEILGKRIQMYGSIENPLFKAVDVAEWIGYQFVKGKNVRNTSKMLKLVDDDEKVKAILGIPVSNNPNTHGGLRSNTEIWFLTEEGVYEVCMSSRKPIAKQMKKEIKKYLKSIRLTGAAIPQGREQDMVTYYFSALSSELQGQIVNELLDKNRKLQQFYDDLMNTEGLMSVNTCAKELGIGEYTLYAYLRNKKVFFYDKDKVNVPYEPFRKQGKFVVKETPCHDGKIRSVTYATKKGLEYMRKKLRKDGILQNN